MNRISDITGALWCLLIVPPLYLWLALVAFVRTCPDDEIPWEMQQATGWGHPWVLGWPYIRKQLTQPGAAGQE